MVRGESGREFDEAAFFAEGFLWVRKEGKDKMKEKEGGRGIDEKRGRRRRREREGARGRRRERKGIP